MFLGLRVTPCELNNLSFSKIFSSFVIAQPPSAVVIILTG
jgi:hypothetical protein